MPQNIVVGQQALEVAEFVAKYAGRKAPTIPGVVKCSQTPIGSIDEALARDVDDAHEHGVRTPQTLTGTSTTEHKP